MLSGGLPAPPGMGTWKENWKIMCLLSVGVVLSLRMTSVWSRWVLLYCCKRKWGWGSLSNVKILKDEWWLRQEFHLGFKLVSRCFFQLMLLSLWTSLKGFLVCFYIWTPWFESSEGSHREEGLPVTDTLQCWLVETTQATHDFLTGISEGTLYPPLPYVFLVKHGFP